jgi:FMN phosphatase YigB (HAD superfamily)
MPAGAPIIPPMPPKFLYFDLGKVLVDFSVEVMFQQIAAVTGGDALRLKEVVIGGGLQRAYETGRLSSRQFYEIFCARTGTAAAYEALALASSDIFTLNYSVLAVVTQLRAAGYPLGALSNTCENHWEHCLQRFRVLSDLFAVHALSYRIGACKPAPAIFARAAEMAGCPPQEIFFIDDMAENVAGAKAAGFDAVQYTSTPQLVAALRQRAVRFNY